MKEIKFRAWDKETKTMVYSDRSNENVWQVHYDFMFGDNGLRCCWEEEYEDNFGYLARSYRELDNIMQYTGLKDKNGEDIYEGDIVELTNIGKMWVGGYYKADKFIVDIKTRTWLKGEEFGYEGERLIDWEDTVVIGNIYENQEIFKGLYNTEITNQNNMTREDC